MKGNYTGLFWWDRGGIFRYKVFVFIRLVPLFFCFYPSSLLFAQTSSAAPQALFEEGRALVASGDLDRAIELFNQVLKINPTHSASYLNLGMIFTRKGNMDQAIQSFGHAVKHDPELMQGHLLLGQAYAAKKMWQRAETAFKTGIALRPRYAGAYYLLGLLHHSTGAPQKAITLFKKVLSLGGTGPEVKEAKARLDEYQKKTDLLFDQAKILLQRGELEKAEKSVSAGLVFDAENPYALATLGDIASKRHLLEQAVTYFKQALEIKGDFFTARLSLAEIYEKQGKMDLAILEYQAVLSSIPDKEKKESILARGKLKQIGETPEIGRIVRPLLLEGTRLVAGRELRKARKAFMAVLSFLPEQVYTLFSLGDIAMLEAGQIDDRLKIPLYAFTNLGEMALLQESLDEAEKWFKKALEIDPNYFRSYLGLGQLYEYRREKDSAIQIYQEAVLIRPRDPRPNLRLGLLFEDLERIEDALKAYHIVAGLPEGQDDDKRALAQGRVDYYEQRYNVDVNTVTFGYDSNSTRSQNPSSDISSDVSLGLTYYLKKRNQFQIPIRLNLSHSRLLRSQFFSLSGGLSLFFHHFQPKYHLSYGYNLQSGYQGGDGFNFTCIDQDEDRLLTRQGQGEETSSCEQVVTNELKSQQSFLSHTVSVELSKAGRIPLQTILHLDYQRSRFFPNPIFSSQRLTVRGTLLHRLSVFWDEPGLVGLSYGFSDNDVEANDQARGEHTIAFFYNQEIMPKLSGNIGWMSTFARFRHFDSLALSQGEERRRRNILDSLSLGLSYKFRPGLSLFARYVHEENRSNLPSIASDLETVGGVDSSRQPGADVGANPESQGAGLSVSLGDYRRDLFLFGVTASADLRRPYPRWSRLGKRFSVGLTTGYYQPSLKDFNKILGDPTRVITQDPNHLLPSNPDFLSEDRNLRAKKIGGDISLGIEAEWEVSKRHGLVFSISEWQSASVANDQVPLLLAATEDPIIVPRSARYNLAINQYLLSWRYSLLNDPSEGRLYFDLGLFGIAFTNLTMDSLLKVAENPIGDPFVSLGSSESRGRSFITRLGIGGSIFIKPWFSVGLNLNYLWGSVRKLKVEREFRSDFRTIPRGLPGITDSPCFRIAVGENLINTGIDTFTEGEILTTIGCEGDLIAQEGEPPRAEVPKPITLKLDGFEGSLAFRFHFGEGTAGTTTFERWMDWGPKEITQGPFARRGLSTKKTSRLKVDGVLKNETAYRINEPVTFTKALTLFRLNTRYSFSPRYELITRTRAFYDAIYDLVDIDTISPRRFPNTILTQLPQVPSSEEVASVDIENSRDVQIVKSRLEMRELFLDIHYKKLDLRIGKQIVRWGVVPGSRVTDEINPFDFSEFILREVQDRFIPLMMVKADYFPGNNHFELIWITEVVPHRPAPEGSEFEQFQILEGFVVPESFLDSNLNLNLSAFKNSEIAGRMVRNMNGLEIGFTAFYTWDDFPASFRAIEGGRGGGFQAAPEVIFAPRMNRITTLGATFSKSFGGFVLNSEYAYTFGKLFGTLLAVEDAALEGTVGVEPSLGELQRDFMKYAIGLDFHLFKTDFSLQFLQQYIPDWDATILQDQIDTVAALFMRKSFMNERLITKMLTLYFINEDDFLLRPVIETRMTDSIKIHFGADFFIGDRGERVGEFDFIGFFKDSNRLYLETIYSF